MNETTAITNAVMAFGNRIVDVKQTEPVKFGDRKETYPVGVNEQGEFVLATIDAYWFASPTNLKLKNMKPALAVLKKAGTKQENGMEFDAKWFDANVRDPFHKVLKFAAQHSLDKGRPVSLAFTRRTNKATSEQVVTVKHGFEHTVVPAKPEQIAQKAAAKAAKQSTKRANRKAPKAPRITPLNAVKASPDNTAVLNQIADNIAAQVGAEITKATLGAAA